MRKIYFTQLLCNNCIVIVGFTKNSSKTAGSSKISRFFSASYNQFYNQI